MIFRRVGITFAVYGAKDEDGAGTERLIPFDLIPRIIPAHEWREMERGLRQRVTALNRFIHDVYHGQEILKAGIVPAEQVLEQRPVPPEMVGVDVPGGIYSHIAGIDIVRAANADGSGSYYVLEDNLRVPERRVLHAREPQDDDAALPRAVQPAPGGAGRALPRPAARDPARGRRRRRSTSRRSSCSRPACTTAPTSSTPSSRSRWASSWSRARTCSSRTTSSTCARRSGPKRVDVIYRRVDDDFLDPLAFRADSTLGCAGPARGLPRRQRRRSANAIGTGVADDKSIYPYVPKMIEFYLGEKPILKNVPTYMCRDADDLAATCSTTWTSWSSRKCTAPAATACWSARRRRRRRSRTSARALQGQPERLHRAADARAVDLPDLRRERHRAAPHRPAAVRALGQGRADGARRPDARRAARKARWWSTRRRAAAPRTPGSSRPDGETTMLSRTADHLFWMARYMERAENTARMLDVNYQTSLLPQSDGARRARLARPAQHQRAAAGDFAKRYGERRRRRASWTSWSATSTTPRRSAAA